MVLNGNKIGIPWKKNSIYLLSLVCTRCLLVKPMAQNSMPEMARDVAWVPHELTRRVLDATADAPTRVK
jgi:hypothetical protein